jgi:hypothetical protein
LQASEILSPDENRRVRRPSNYGIPESRFLQPKSGEASLDRFRLPTSFSPSTETFTQKKWYPNGTVLDSFGAFFAGFRKASARLGTLQHVDFI